jgi:ATP-dependent Zn protease
MIDIEVRKQIDACYQKTKALLTEKRDKLEELSQILLKREILFQHDLEEILGKRPFDVVKEETPVEITAAEETQEKADTETHE